jgi:two-component system nitrogen regulation sensor histidine kinase NtrY
VSARTSDGARRATPDGLERRLRRLLVALAAPGALATLAVVAALPVNGVLRGCLALLAALGYAALAWAVHHAVTHPLRGLANVVEALRGGDYSVRARGAAGADALGELVRDVNALADTLRDQRLRALEASALVDQLLARVDVAILAVDGRGEIALANAAAERLLGAAAGELLGRRADALGVAELLALGADPMVLPAVAGRAGRWQVSHGTFREGGLSQHLLIVADVRRALRDEERQAWQRLLRVVGHEVKNSLAPMKSLAGTLGTIVGRVLPESGDRRDVLSGLEVIEARAASLDRFLAQYARLARVPEPKATATAIAPLLRRVAALAPERTVTVSVEDGLAAELDADLVEQALVNLLRNALDAAGPAGAVSVEAEGHPEGLRIRVLDDGPGIANPDNLFVPFFTTKPGGSGVGLALSRQIAEAHGGTLSLENRVGGRGAVATLDLPGARRSR